MKRIYLDNNASTFVDPAVAHVISHTLTHYPGNPSSPHTYGQEARRLLIQSRETIARFLKVRPKEIIFTSGGTEGASLVIQGLMNGHKEGHIVTSNLEHACVYSLMQRLAKEGKEVTFLQPGLKGSVSVQEVKAALRHDTKMIALMAVNNETGIKNDIKAIAHLAEEAHIPLFVDGVALLGKEAFDIPSGVSAISFSGHKFHAAKGSGFIYLNSQIKLSPLFLGGEQEYNRRGGTENLADIAGMAEAIKMLEPILPQVSQKMLELRNYFEDNLKQELGEDVKVNGEGERICNTANLAFSGVDGESLLIALDLEGIAASHGSACASGALEPSRILLNMGIPLERVRQSLRFSLSRYTTQQEIDDTLEVLIRLIRKFRKK